MRGNMRGGGGNGKRGDRKRREKREIQKGITETGFLKVILENIVLEATVCTCLCMCVCMLCVFLE